MGSFIQRLRKKVTMFQGRCEYLFKNIEIFDRLIDKMESGYELTKKDIIELTFTPIMGGKLSKGDKILKAIHIVKDINKDYKYDIESILYVFASKFLEGKELEKVKELLDILSVEMIAKKTGLTVEEVEVLKSK